MVFVLSRFLWFLVQLFVVRGAPNIIIIIADDMGWNDVSFHGSDQIPTPNLDALAYNGIILNNHYVQSICTPSRSALLSGKYPFKLGMQGPPLGPSQGGGLPPGKVLPQYFKGLGYDTHLVGKWHLGYDRWNITPTHRGFDHHFGYLNGWISYYDHLATATINGKQYTGYDFRRDHEVAWDVMGKYATDILTDHATNLIDEHNTSKPLFMLLSHLAIHAGNNGKLLEAPQETVDKFSYIIDSNRRTLAAMVSKLDDSVGQIVQALDRKKMLENSIILFFSDNGAPTVGYFSNWSSNYPFKGIKDTLHEGGIRTPAFIWSPLLAQNARVSNELMHITDWLPTLYSAAGGDTSTLDLDLDGTDQWSSLQFDLPSARNDVLINIDEKTKNAALRFANWKLIVGTTYNGTYNGYFGETGRENSRNISYDVELVLNSPTGQALQKSTFSPVGQGEIGILRRLATITCSNPKSRNACDNSGSAYCLYDIPNDPCEQNNLASYFPSVVRRMKRVLVEYKAGLETQISTERHIEEDDPKLFQYTWNPWVDCADVACTE